MKYIIRRYYEENTTNEIINSNLSSAEILQKLDRRKITIEIYKLEAESKK